MARCCRRHIAGPMLLRLLASLAALLAGVFTPAVLATEFTSGNQRVQLIELYTSEGCSSCPPADRWLSQYKQHEQLWTAVVPVAFHVDYWDYIGWKDPFADKSHSQRQRAYARYGGLSRVYTPGILANGMEWRQWFVDRSRPPLNTVPAAELILRAEDGQFSANFAGEGDTLHIAWLGFDLRSPVAAGENRGTLLRHDFVVMAHATYRGRSQWSGSLPPRGDASQARALVAWVSDGKNPAPLQAVGGWYP